LAAAIATITMAAYLSAASLLPFWLFGLASLFVFFLFLPCASVVNVRWD
jgi:hypothetical protein